MNTTSASRHTAGEWIADGYSLREKRGRLIAYFGPRHTPPDEYPPGCRAVDEANCARAAALHSALAGLSLDDVRRALQQCEDAISGAFDARVFRNNLKQEHHNAMDKLRDALATLAALKANSI